MIFDHIAYTELSQITQKNIHQSLILPNLLEKISIQT